MKLRNIAIIAHVDHGKTTLVDRLLQQSGAFRENQRVAERVMDSNDLEKERGITIMAKATSVAWKDSRINIVDTPGHADFGGEVERILVHGRWRDRSRRCLRRADAADEVRRLQGLEDRPSKPIVAVNKVDKPDARVTEVVNEIFDLFAALDASEEQLDFPILYGSAKQGWMAESPDGPKESMAPLFDLVLRHVPAPKIEEGGFRMLGTLLEANPYLGRIVTGRVFAGSIKPNQSVKVLDRKGNVVEQGRVSKILAFRGIERAPIEEAEAGDIVAIAGLEKFNVADTLCAPEVSEPLQAQPIDPPTLSMTFMVNDSPLAGTEGDKVTSRVIRARLMKEAEGNVALKVEDSPGGESFVVSGRGELQLAILIETMRREGFELACRGRKSSSRRTKRPASCWSRSKKSSSTSTRNFPASSCRRWPSARPRWSRCGRLAAIVCGSSSTHRRAASSAIRAS